MYFVNLLLHIVMELSPFQSYLHKNYIHLMNNSFAPDLLSLHSLITTEETTSFWSSIQTFVTSSSTFTLYPPTLSCLCLLSCGEHLAWDLFSFVFCHFWHLLHLLLQCICLNYVNTMFNFFILCAKSKVIKKTNLCT